MPGSIDAPLPATAPSPPPPLPERVVLEPGFGRAAQGLWSLLWRSRLTWRRSPVLLASLLLIPTLTYITIEPMQMLGRYDWRQRPREVLGEFRGEAGDLPSGTRGQLAQIIREEQ